MEQSQSSEADSHSASHKIPHLPLKSKYSPQHPLFKHDQPRISSQCERQVLHA